MFENLGHGHSTRRQVGTSCYGIPIVLLRTVVLVDAADLVTPVRKCGGAAEVPYTALTRSYIPARYNNFLFLNIHYQQG